MSSGPRLRRRSSYACRGRESRLQLGKHSFSASLPRLALRYECTNQVAVPAFVYACEENISRRSPRECIIVGSSPVTTTMFAAPVHRRGFATSCRALAGLTGPVESRAVVFAEHGDPTKVLKAHRYRLDKLDKGQVRLRFELGAISELLPGCRNSESTLSLMPFTWNRPRRHREPPHLGVRGNATQR